MSKPPCSCGHPWSLHDTGWDASGCMHRTCSCRSYREANPSRPEPDLPIWAQDKAREYNRKWWDKDACNIEAANASLAALLVEVTVASARVAVEVERPLVLAEVRRVVAHVREHETMVCSSVNTWRFCCDEILARLDKLDTPRLSTEQEAKAIMGAGQPLTKLRELL